MEESSAIASVWSRMSKGEVWLLVATGAIAVICTVAPTAVALASPDLAVRLDSGSEAYFDPEETDPWGRSWRYLPPESAKGLGTLAAVDGVLTTPEGTPASVAADQWDRYSVGPNGVDELGEGDDVLARGSPSTAGLLFDLLPMGSWVFLGFVTWIWLGCRILASPRKRSQLGEAVLGGCLSLPILLVGHIVFLLLRRDFSERELAPVLSASHLVPVEFAFLCSLLLLSTLAWLGVRLRVLRSRERRVAGESSDANREVLPKLPRKSREF